MKRNRARLILLAAAAVLVAQIGLSYRLDRSEYLPNTQPLSMLPAQVAEWKLAQEIPVEEAILEMLGPDDVVNRVYRSEGQPDLSLFVSYYRTQHRARNAHDPKVCLPGAGWNPTESRTIEITPAGNPVPLSANYYVVSRGGNKAVVVYWFQTHRAGYAREQSLKLARVFQTIADKRTDMALVRIVVPAAQDDERQAGERAIEFAKNIYPSVLRFFE